MAALLTLLSLFLSATIVFSQSEGDLRLVVSSLVYNNLGRLDIFWKGKWSTFCGIDKGGGQAACRQLGFIDFYEAVPYNKVNKTLVPRAEDGMPIAIETTSCAYNFAGGEDHILRCDYTTDTSSCSHDNDFVLECQAQSHWLHPYESQVRLVSGSYPSSGTLEVYYNKKWGNVCHQSTFNQHAADSVCRQLAYTNAKTITTTNAKSKDVVWLNGAQCGGSSCVCLNRCLRAPSSPTTCSSGDYVSVNCTFDVSKAKSLTPGSENTCSYPGGCSGGSGGTSVSIPAVVGAILVLGFLFIVSVVVTSALCFVVPACPLAQWRARSSYGSVN